MGWAQQGVAPGKRQYNNENSDSHSATTNSILSENKSDEDETVRAQYNKRSRDTSPQRKPLGCMDMIGVDCKNINKQSESIQEYDMKKMESVSFSSSTESIESSSVSSELSSTEDNTYSNFTNRTQINELKSLQLTSSHNQRGNGDGFSFAVPSNSKGKQAVKPKVGVSVGARGTHAVTRNVNPRKAYELKASKGIIHPSPGTRAEPVDDDDSEDSEFSTDDLDTDGIDEEESESDETTTTPSDSDKETESSVETDTSESIDVIPNASGSGQIKIISGIRPSQFSYVPPFINFCQHDESCECLPSEIKSLMKWRLSTITPVVVRKTVTSTGFRPLKKTVEWTGQWGKHMKATMFRAALKDYQKLNHLPATFQIGRKDKLWRNYQRHSFKFGLENFSFLPKSFILPQELKSFKQAWDSSPKGKPWIIKPPAGARGNGIRVINKWGQVPKKRSTIVQKYISKPYLINSRKFDIRLYVLVTSFHPLKIYIYRDGLVRFAPVKYSQDSKRVSDRYMHLTNYSINKHCELYTQNEDAESCEGHKWTLKSLWRYLKDENYDTDDLWRAIEDIVIKTLICAEEPITASSFNLPSRYNGYELFGFDIILDEKLKPWLLEVNISPSLHSSSPLDLAVKGPLIKEVFNIVGYHFPDLFPKFLKKKFVHAMNPQVKLETPVFDRRLYSTTLSTEEKLKQNLIKQNWNSREKYMSKILENLTPDDVRYLIQSEDEFSQCSGFNRIFPSSSAHEYFQFFEGPRYYNMLFDAWETKYCGNRVKGIRRLQELCDGKFHLQCVHSSKNTILDNGSSISEWMKEDVANGNREISSQMISSTLPSSNEAHRNLISNNTSYDDDSNSLAKMKRLGETLPKAKSVNSLTASESIKTC